MERKGVITMEGAPLTIVGEEIKDGQIAPDFTVLDGDLKEKKLSDFNGKIKLIASVPSLDTPVCDLQIKRFNDEASKLAEDIVVIFISMDLPFAQKRFCQAYDINKVKITSRLIFQRKHYEDSDAKSLILEFWVQISLPG